MAETNSDRVASTPEMRRRFGEMAVARMMAMATWRERLAFLLALGRASRRDAGDRALVDGLMRALIDRGWFTEARDFTDAGLRALGVPEVRHA